MIHQERIQTLNRKHIKDRKYVLYWMQASQRAEFNHALEYAVLQANQLNKPILVFFGITDHFPEANARHYLFMFEGLREAQSSLKTRGVRMIIRHQSPELGAVELSRNAALVVADRGYLKIQKQWRKFVAERIDCPLIQVESDVVVPVELASPKNEFSAATFRPKIRKHLNQFLQPIEPHKPIISSLNIDFESFDTHNIEKAISQLPIDKSVGKAESFQGGTSEAQRHLDRFIETKLNDYPELRNDPNQDSLSNMSPYLHFGQISPLYIALEVMKTESSGQEALLEELIVRRELSMNFIHYDQNYDSYTGLPEWARVSLDAHRNDEREYIYALEEFEAAQTHDPYWNAAQREMLFTGKMHGYMRMYWGKKILEWCQKPEEAFRIALYLNNKYELDGRDPNGFTGVAWCFGKHDRPWKERPIFGKIRYMNANGLKRKFDADAYVEKINRSII